MSFKIVSVILVKCHAWLYFYIQTRFNQILEVLLHDSSSCTSSSSEDDALDLLLFEFCFAYA